MGKRLIKFALGVAMLAATSAQAATMIPLVVAGGGGGGGRASNGGMAKPGPAAATAMSAISA